MTSGTQAETAAAKTEAHCSFCAKPASELKAVIAGPGVYICNECVAACAKVFAEQGDKPAGARQQQQQLPAWEESLTDEQLLHLVSRLASAAAHSEANLQRMITQLRERRVTWARIGTALQITRQSAWERFSGEE